MEISYLFAPFLGYLVAGSIKFGINTMRAKQLAFSNIGMGGMPSTHNTITSTTFFAISFGEGFNSSAAAVALMVCFIVAIDSMDLRKKIESHAALIVRELAKTSVEARNIRTKLGHKPAEVVVAWVIGAALGYILSSI